MKNLIRSFFLMTLLLVMAAGAQAITLTDLFGGGSITAGDKLFDNWSLDFYDSGDFRSFDSDNIEVTGLSDGGNDPGPGLRFSVLNSELTVSGDNIYNYVDLTFSFRASVLDPGLQIKDNSLGGFQAFFGYQVDGFNDAGSYIHENVGTGFGLNDLAVEAVEFSVLDDISTSVLTDSANFLPQSELWVTKNILVWAVDDTDSAGIFAFEQRFSQTAVPEPSTFVLLGLGLVGALAVRRCSKKG